MTVGIYEVERDGVTSTFQLSEDDAKRLGAKKVVPTNKKVDPAPPDPAEKPASKRKRGSAATK